MYYGCEELARQGWFVKGKTQKVPIAYDRRCMNHVFFFKYRGQSFYKRITHTVRNLLFSIDCLLLPAYKARRILVVINLLLSLLNHAFPLRLP
nr:hypothetical protein [Paenibacillus dendritiformis]